MSTAKNKRSLPATLRPSRGKDNTAGRSKKPAQRARSAEIEALGNDPQFLEALDRFILEYEVKAGFEPGVADYEAHAKLLDEWAQGFPMTKAERQTLEEIGALRPDPGPEPAEVGEPQDDGRPADADPPAPVIGPREMAALAGLLVNVATRLRTAAAPGADGRNVFAASVEPVLADVATAVRLLVEFLNTDCMDNNLAPAVAEQLRQEALSWPGIYYAHPAPQKREQKRQAKVGSQLPLRMAKMKGPSPEACAAVDVLLAVQENIFWLLAVQPQKDGRPARADALETWRLSIVKAGEEQPGPTMAEAIAANADHPLRLPVDGRGAVVAPLNWNTWKRLFECVMKLRHGSEQQRDEANDLVDVEPADVPLWLQPVDLCAGELARKMKRRGESRVLGEIREHGRNYFAAGLFDMKRSPRR